MSESVQDILDRHEGVQPLQLVHDGHAASNSLTPQTWITALHNTEGELAVRFGGTGNEPYYLWVYENTIFVERGETATIAREDVDGYVESLFATYEISPVVTASVPYIDGPEGIHRDDEPTCAGTTKDDEPCERTVPEAGNYCWQHVEQADNGGE